MYDGHLNIRKCQLKPPEPGSTCEFGAGDAYVLSPGNGHLFTS